MLIRTKTAFKLIKQNLPFLNEFPILNNQKSNIPFKSTTTKSLNSFSIHSKTKQLILHSPNQIQRLHNQKNKRKQQKNKQWTVFKQKTEKFNVSLIGLPNCGKSSLFNCLIGQRLAIVDKQYGMTRDRRQFNVLNGIVNLIDTPGIQVTLLKNNKSKVQNQNNQSRQQLKQDIFQQSLNAISQSHLILFVIDAKKQAFSQQQIMLAKYLKTFNSSSDNHNKCQIVVVCNKCDGLGWDQQDLINQIYSKLKIFDQNQQGKIFYSSSQEGSGVFQILQYINKKVPYQMKAAHQKLRKQRRQKFEKLVKKMKQQIKQYNQKFQTQQNLKSQQKKTNQDQNNINTEQQSKPKINISQSKRIKIKQWESDFRDLNPNPQQNEQLDHQNYQQYFLRPQQAFSPNRGVQIKNLRMKHSIKICFIGKPNVGKSSIINELLEQQKLIVSDVPHTTRDALTTKILYKNRKIQLIDTAGLNTPRITQNQQQYLRKSQISTMLHVQQSHVIVYVMDAYSAFKVDDFKLINRVIKEGRPVVIVVNKWQSIKQQYKGKARQYLMSQLQKNLGQLHGCPIVFVSAKMILNIDQMMDKIIMTYDKWNKRVSTGLLNNWLQKFKKLDNLPKDNECTLKINYIIQARVRPPHFIFFVNKKEIFKQNYMRFLLRNMAQQFQLDGIPLRHTLRSTNNKENQYSKKRRSNMKKKNSKNTQKMQQLKNKYGDFTI